MKKIIWYIDRDEQIGKIIAAELPKLTRDFKVCIINNPLIIDDKLKEELPDIIFIDSAMAEQDNGMIIHDFKTNKNLEKTPIVIMGSDVRLEDRARELKIESLKKPFDVKQLFEKTRHIVRM